MNALQIAQPIPRPDIPTIEIDQRVIDTIRAGALVVLNLSGGKDSVLASKLAMDALDKLGHPRDRRIAIHADLGTAEWTSTGNTVAEQAETLGLPLVTVARAAGDMISRWEQRYIQGLGLYMELKQVRMRGPWSSSSSRFCTSELKVEVIHRYLAANYPGQTIVSILGIRRSESSGRKSTPTSKIDTRLKRADGTNGIVWHPIAAVPTEAVIDLNIALGLPLHEAYTTYGSTRLSCAFCVLASKHDLEASASAAQNAALYRRLVGMEASTGFSFQQKLWLADIAPKLLDEETLRSIASAKAYADRRRAAEAPIGTSFLATSKDNPWPQRLPTSCEAQAIAEARRVTQDWIEKEVPYRTAAAVTQRISELHSSRKRL